MPSSIVPDGGEESWSEGTPPSEAVITALAEKTETDQEELPPLFEVIDPGALDRLFAERDPGTVTFSYCGHEVSVTRAGKISIQSE